MAKHRADFLKRLSQDILIACNVPAADARVVGDHLIECNLRGLDSHGIQRLVQYVDLIEAGGIVPGAQIKIISDTGSTAVMDCGLNFGQVAGLEAVNWAISRAREHGLSMIVTRRCNHVGRVGAYSEAVARAGMIALAGCNGPKSAHWVPPFGGRDGRFCSNPFSFAAPTSSDPVVLDWSTSASSEGKLRTYKNRGQMLPDFWVADTKGNPSKDPNVYYGPPEGVILPLGGVTGYKGTALAMMVEVLGGALSSQSITQKDVSFVNGLFLIVIDISRFVGPEQFNALLDEMVSYLKSSQPVSEDQRVFFPGEPDYLQRLIRMKEGIEIDPPTWAKVVLCAEKLNVDIKAE